MTKFLDVGSSWNTNANMFKNHGVMDVTRLDIDSVNKPDIVHDITKPFPDELVGAFDVVLASHVLEHIRYRQVRDACKNIVSAAKPGGEVWIFVPSMTWAAKKILEGEETFGLMGTIWGGQLDDYDYHYCGFTMNSLSVLMAHSGLRDIRIAEQDIAIALEGKEYPLLQITAMGYRI